MCKIDLPRKNMVIERERTRGRRKRGCWESAHTLTHTQITHAKRNTLKHWKEYRGKVLAWVE